MSIHTKRLNKIVKKLKNIPVILITDIENVFYLSGFTGSNAFLLISEENKFLITDARYTLQSSKECPDFEIIEYGKETLWQIISKLLPQNISGLGFEANTISYNMYLEMKEKLNINLIETRTLVENLRYYKDRHEISLVRKAAKLIDKVTKKISTEIKPGVSEWEIAVKIEHLMREMGALKVGFDSIVASGINAACPHHSPTDNIIKENDMVKCDFGCVVNNYNADITRTFFVGEPDTKFKEIYQIVLDAQLKAIEAIKPGIVGKEIDKIARDYISDSGYGEYFGHGLGHSLGINVHDGPAFSPSSEVILKPGFIATVEPGIYIPDWGGIRIEDDVLVTKDGYEILTKSPK